MKSNKRCDKMKSDIEKTFKSLIEIVNTTKYTLSEIMKMKNQFIAYTGSPCLSELKWKFGYNPKTKQCDLGDGMGYIERAGKDSNRKVYDLDFGPGIYLTSNKELACSWACTQMEDIAIGIDVVNGRFCPQSVRRFCPIIAGFNAGTYKVPACVL